MAIADPRAVIHRDKDKLISHLDRYRYDFPASVLMIKVTMHNLKEHAPLSCIIWYCAHKLQGLTKSFYPNVNTCRQDILEDIKSSSCVNQIGNRTSSISKVIRFVSLIWSNQ